ncbi:hypothetical protein [Nocardioides zhouii]|uniref:Uncharacterized protein n=1 Tax=Nocardioides zhouii TaxID=1168729 RepID=A0A4Q2TC29_9ACTN|nr:hypothetical protein [Nocardioides zhouii]RYC14830.1 hypothetical protein EUA94_01530 [Nocardioides zhouii]
MDHTATRRPVDLAPPRDLSIPALVLAVLSVPGSIVTWDWLPGGGFAWGLPPALLAVALGAAQLNRSRTGRTRAVVAVVVAAAMILMMAVWTIADLG